MAKTAHLDIRADHLDMVKRILSNQLHTDYHVWVYGSRATWQAKDHSDLDLAIAQKNGEKTPYPTLAALETDFEESDLPWKVDVVDWHSLNTDFKQAIQQQRVSLQWGTEEKTQVDSRGGVMSVDWPQFQLGERCTVKSSKRIFAHEYVDDGIPFMRSKDVIDKALGAFLGYDLYISEERFLEIKKTHGSPKFGDLLMSFVGNRSGHPYVIQNEGDFHFKDGNILWLSEFKDINPDFLAYWLKSQIGQAALASVMIGSAQKALTIDSIRKLWLRFPPLKNQDSIVKILLGLDNKIELNRQTNQTLENIAQAIFKSWFVDFDPTRAKIAARENGQDPELAAMASIAGKTIDKLNGLREDQLENLKSTAALFPDKLVESSFGEAPICWNWGEIGNEISIVGGGTPSTKNEEFWDGGNIPWTSPKDMSNLTDKILIDTARKKEGLKKNQFRVVAKKYSFNVLTCSCRLLSYF
jgi:restriction endonuclease S subunit/predicted nucleotidyltransferase